MIIIDNAAYEKQRFLKTFPQDSKLELSLIPTGVSNFVIRIIDYKYNLFYETEGREEQGYRVFDCTICLPDLVKNDCIFGLLFCKSGFLVKVYKPAYTDLRAYFLDKHCRNNPKEDNPEEGNISQVIFYTKHRKRSFILPCSSVCQMLIETK